MYYKVRHENILIKCFKNYFMKLKSNMNYLKLELTSFIENKEALQNFKIIHSIKKKLMMFYQHSQLTMKKSF